MICGWLSLSTIAPLVSCVLFFWNRGESLCFGFWFSTSRLFMMNRNGNPASFCSWGCMCTPEWSYFRENHGSRAYYVPRSCVCPRTLLLRIVNRTVRSCSSFYSGTRPQGPWWELRLLFTSADLAVDSSSLEAVKDHISHFTLAAL